jgi:hypothetical protein
LGNYFARTDGAHEWIDDAFVTDRILSDWQIQSIYNSTEPYNGFFQYPELPPPPPPSEEIEYGTTTISLIYSNYTDKWTTPTPLFREITELLGKLVNPILVWFEKFKGYFDKNLAKSYGENFASSLKIFIQNTKLFNNLFGNLPVGESLIIFFIILIIKIFINFISKIASIIKPI